MQVHSSTNTKIIKRNVSSRQFSWLSPIILLEIQQEARIKINELVNLERKHTQVDTKFKLQIRNGASPFQKSRMENNEEVKLLSMLYLEDSDQDSFVHRGLETEPKFQLFLSYDSLLH